MTYYLNPSREGVAKLSSLGDGSNLKIQWYRALPSNKENLVAYNIYMSEEQPVFPEDFFAYNNPSFVSTDGKLSTTISDLVPGQMYRIGVRPVEYDPTSFDLRTLPALNNGLKFYPTTLLREDIGEDDLIIPVLDVSEFPNAGTIKVGVELIQYSSLDTINNNFLLNSALQRGFNGTIQTFHDIDGYDGYEIWNPNVILCPIISEDGNTVVFSTQNRVDLDHYAFNNVDGYRQRIEDAGNQNMDVSDIDNTGFPAIDLSGYNRIDPVALISGDCVGSYFGGEYGCADGYGGVGLQLRGLSVQDMNTQREELQLTLDGEPVVLMKRNITGIRCYCILPTSEQPDPRCRKCFGGGVILSYSQYFNPRRSDGKVLVRFDPYQDSLPLTDSGWNVQDVKPGAWTLVIPNMKPRDFLIRFDADGNEEFRYEIINVTRNVMFQQQYGAQKLSLQRIRKTDIIYQCKYLPNGGSTPMILNTSIASSIGIPPHYHSWTYAPDQPITSLSQFTSQNAGHSHLIQYDSGSGTLKIIEQDDFRTIGHTHDVLI